ncbi:MAG TPA: prenyltransferase/squalene oxidase repeat-containing protein [Gemmatimonadales bacterium]|nr:prenyltransferase/squalene oxidase repeat-containing protein [Gemmatimonadales bacterium]
MRRPAVSPARALRHDLENAISRGRDYLLAQADREFDEAAHEMRFPRRAGFRARQDLQRGDVFVRATLASICLDLAELDAEACGRSWHEIASREADYVAESKLTDRAGGWSYFPNLPELPPDTDSLAVALRLFSRVAPHHLPLCDEPVRLALAEQRPDGSLPTWIIGETDPQAGRRSMRRGITRYWGSGADVDVCARLFTALHSADHARFSEAIRRGAEWIASQQMPSGLWPATWYWGDVYGSGLCLDLLRRLNSSSAAVSRCLAAVRELQRSDGGWGVWESVPLDTAVAIALLVDSGVADTPERIRGGCRLLFEHQASDGSWPATPWIKMDPGRVSGRKLATLAYQSRTVTTAFVMRSMATIRRL